MTPKTQSVCKHCQKSVAFRGNYWLQVETNGYLSDKFCAVNPNGRHEAEPASTGEPRHYDLPCPSTKKVGDDVFYCTRRGHDDDNHTYFSARPSEPSAPQGEPNILERVKKAFPEFAAPQPGYCPSHGEKLVPIFGGQWNGCPKCPRDADGFTPPAPQTSAEPQHETTDCLHDFGGYSMGTYRGHFYPVAPQPVSDPAPSPTPSVSTEPTMMQQIYGNQWFVAHSGFLQFGPCSEKTAREIVAQKSANDLEWEAVEFSPVAHHAALRQTIARGICEVLAKTKSNVCWMELVRSELAKHGVGAPAQPGPEEKIVNNEKIDMQFEGMATDREYQRESLELSEGKVAANQISGHLDGSPCVATALPSINSAPAPAQGTPEPPKVEEVARKIMDEVRRRADNELDNMGAAEYEAILRPYFPHASQTPYVAERTGKTRIQCCPTCGAPNGNCDPGPCRDGIVLMTKGESNQLREEDKLRRLSNEQLVAAVFGPDVEYQGHYAKRHRTEFLKRMSTSSRAPTRDAVKWLEDMGYGVNGKFALDSKRNWQGYEIKEILELFALGFPESGRTDPLATPASTARTDGPRLCAICTKNPALKPHGYCQECYTQWYGQTEPTITPAAPGSVPQAPKDECLYGPVGKHVSSGRDRMSLAEKFDEIAMSYASSHKFFILQDLQRAFYAGAEAVMREEHEQRNVCRTSQAEIDHFRSHK